MSGLRRLERLHRWTLDGKRRQAIELDRLIDGLAQDIVSLDQRVRSEVEAARGKVTLERALPAYRKVMAERRVRLEHTITNLRCERDRLQDAIQESFNELKSTEQVIANRAERERRSEQSKERADNDEIGRQQHRLR